RTKIMNNRKCREIANAFDLGRPDVEVNEEVQNREQEVLEVSSDAESEDDRSSISSVRTPTHVPSFFSSDTDSSGEEFDSRDGEMDSENHEFDSSNEELVDDQPEPDNSNDGN